MNFDNFNFRCSSLGHIMTDPKGKSFREMYDTAVASFDKKVNEYREIKNKDTATAKKLLEQVNSLDAKITSLEHLKDIPNLSESCKTHLCDIYVSAKYGRREDVVSKYLEKGNHVEEDAITLWSLVTGEIYANNKERKGNEFIDGECDIDDGETISDTKSSWSIFTFMRVIAKPIKPLYHWQLDGYMWLWNRKKGRLIYSLVDTPDFLIEREYKKLTYELFGSEQNKQIATEQQILDYNEACKEILHNHKYPDIPNQERVHIFNVERSDERIEKIKKRVAECRYYLNNITNTVKYENETETE